jgi:hypothetical protein
MLIIKREAKSRVNMKFFVIFTCLKVLRERNLKSKILVYDFQV